MIKIFKIDINTADQRIDKFFKRQFCNLTQSFIEKNLRKKNILVNNHSSKSNYLIRVNDKITIKNFSEKIYIKFKPKKSSVNIDKFIINKFNKSIVYQSDNFLVINKWFGIASQGGTNVIISIDKTKYSR